MLVELHWIDLDAPQWASPNFRELLSPQEKARVDRYVFARDRSRALAGWAARRIILGKVLGSPAASLSFAEETEGRPYLIGRPLQFNLSHSGGQAVLATTDELHREMGVDVEFTPRKTELEPLARRFFHPAEVAHLHLQDFSARVFFRIWTAKEAYLKAIGTGLRRPLDSFTVVEEDRPWMLRQPPGQTLEGWKLQHFSHPQDEDYCGCLCARQMELQIAQHLFHVAGP